MKKSAPKELPQRFFEDVDVGANVPVSAYGPHDMVTSVFWAGVQENPGRMHFDRDYAREFRNAKSIVASGALRQSFMTRTIMEWAGPRAFLKSTTIRHTASTYEGDMQRYGATVVEKSPDPENPWITLEIDARNQDGDQIIKGSCTLLLPCKNWAIDRQVWRAA